MNHGSNRLLGPLERRVRHGRGLEKNKSRPKPRPPPRETKPLNDKEGCVDFMIRLERQMTDEASGASEAVGPDEKEKLKYWMVVDFELRPISQGG